MDLGVIARADRGGLAQVTVELVRALRPAAVLLVDLLENGRGPTDPERVKPYCGRLWVAPQLWSTTYAFPVDCDDFFHASDVVYTCETAYDRRTYAMCRGYGKPVVLHAMPEMLSGAQARDATDLWLPTDWRYEQVTAVRGADRTPPEVVPVPVAVDRFAARYRRRDRADVFFCHGGEAFHDRNGLGLVEAALGAVDRPVRLLVRGGPRPDRDRRTVGKVTVEWLPPTDDYVDVIPAETDVLLMPRRYGGLTLPVAEAAAQGIPAVMSNLPPQTGWIDPDLLVPMLGSTPVDMKGGLVDVWDTHPAYVADAINLLAGNGRRVGVASDAAYRWADRYSWDRWAPTYTERLEAIAAR